MVAPEQLIDMPLHSITETFGESGLRARFALELVRFDPYDQFRLTSALNLASDLHRDDRRVHEPYLNHLLRVATRIICHYQVTDADVVAAGLLHDTVEDHAPELAIIAADSPVLAPHPAGSRDSAAFHGPATMASQGTTGDQALRALESRFGVRVADLVAAVTNPVYSPGRNPDEQYLEHVAASLETSPWARVVKVSDFTDNGVGVIHIAGPKALRAASKYRPLVPVLRDLVARPDTPLSQGVKNHIFAQLTLAEERFRDILGRPDSDG